jgi:hypothetical protein
MIRGRMLALMCFGFLGLAGCTSQPGPQNGIVNLAADRLADRE